MLLEDPIGSSIEFRDGIAVLTVRGEVDVASAPAFKSAIGEALGGNPRGLVLDLLEVEFLGSIGVRVLLEAQEKIGVGKRFAVVARRPAAGRILQLLRLDEVLSVHDTVDEAVSWVAAG